MLCNSHSLITTINGVVGSIADLLIQYGKRTCPSIFTYMSPSFTKGDCSYWDLKDV